MLKNAKNVLKERMENLKDKEYFFIWNILEYQVFKFLIEEKSLNVKVETYRSDILERENEFSFKDKDSLDTLSTINSIMCYIENLYYDLKDKSFEYYDIFLNDKNISKKIKIFKEIEGKVSNETLKGIIFD